MRKWDRRYIQLSLKESLEKKRLVRKAIRGGFVSEGRFICKTWTWFKEPSEG